MIYFSQVYVSAHLLDQYLGVASLYVYYHNKIKINKKPNYVLYNRLCMSFTLHKLFHYNVFNQA